MDWKRLLGNITGSVNEDPLLRRRFIPRLDQAPSVDESAVDHHDELFVGHGMNNGSAEEQPRNSASLSEWVVKRRFHVESLFAPASRAGGHFCEGKRD